MTPKEAFKTAVASRIGDDKNHGWGVDDSVAVIEALIENEVGEKPDSALMELIKHVVNPSAFRQSLEKAGKLATKAQIPRGLVGLID